MDKNKKKQIIAMIVATVISLTIGVVSAVLGISPDSLVDVMPDTGVISTDAPDI